MSDIKGILTICRRAGKLIAGMDEVKKGCRSAAAVGIIISGDISNNSLSEITSAAKRAGIPVYQTDMSTYDVGMALGKPYAVMAVTDPGFLNAMKKGLTELDI